jgi:MscS family membrane protein
MSGKYSGCLRLWVILLALWSPVAGMADTGHPLEPPDLSSPRATLNTFLSTGDAFFHLLSDEYWQAPSRAAVDRLHDLNVNLERMFDLSGIPPAAGYQLGRDGVVYLYEVLSRIQLPPEAEIPDAAVYADTRDGRETGDKSISWTIPHTDITLVRVADGPGAGQFLFSSSTVARAEEFYEKVQALPYQREVPLKNYADMRPYLSIGASLISSHTIEGFPGWLKRSAYQQAVWKWIALAMLIVVIAIVLVIIHRLARRGFSNHAGSTTLRGLVTPLSLLLTPLALDLANRELTLTGWVSGGIIWLAEAVTYFALAWVAWTGSMALAEAVIASPKISNESLNAHLLRLLARVFGIVAVIVILLYVSNQLGAPLYGLVAGLGVGGIAIALAAQPSIENFIGSLNLFADQPVRVGDFCRYGEDPTPD